MRLLLAFALVLAALQSLQGVQEPCTAVGQGYPEEGWPGRRSEGGEAVGRIKKRRHAQGVE
jgi:hypothetical protein